MKGVARAKEQNSPSIDENNKRKRKICERCARPSPASCICSALPSEPLALSNTRLIVLQHPKECKRKNSSLPLIELSLGNNWKTSGDKLAEKKEDFTMYKIVARRWGEQVVDPAVWNTVNNPDEPVLLCFPSDDAISIEDAMQRISLENQSQQHTKSVSVTQSETQKQVGSKQYHERKINIIFIDATWKFAKEMDSKTMQNEGWPKHTIRVKISNFGEDFKPKRFDIRTPPSTAHLSTAECIAQALKVVEENGEELFDVLMRPLDLMVQQWHSFSDNNKKRHKTDN
jgi:DTW domain-containing protein YfiP